MFRIRKPRNFNFIQIAFISALGVFGGAYIYQPLIIKFVKGEKSEEKTPEPAKQ